MLFFGRNAGTLRGKVGDVWRNSGVPIYSDDSNRERTMNITRTFALLVILATLPGCEKFSAQQSPESPVRIVRPPVGRFLIVFSPIVRADTFLLDTQKGRVWQMTKFSDLPSEPTAWNEMDVIDSTGEVGIKFNDFLQQNSPPRAPERKGKKQ